MNFGTKYYFRVFLMRKIKPAFEISVYIILMFRFSVTTTTEIILKTTTTAATAKNDG